MATKEGSKERLPYNEMNQTGGFGSKSFMDNRENSHSAVGTQERFFTMNNGEQVNGNMMMTGMSKRADSDMMQAKNQLKLVSHQQSCIQARIIKLAKEEEKAQKRIREVEKKAVFVSNMQQIKENRLNDKLALGYGLKAKEFEMRNKINEERECTKKNIIYRKLSIFQQNQIQGDQIKEQQKKIRETIDFNRKAHLQ